LKAFELDLGTGNKNSWLTGGAALVVAMATATATASAAAAQQLFCIQLLLQNHSANFNLCRKVQKTAG